MTPLAAVAVFFLGLNGAFCILAPSVFVSDRARGPYTVANNYELTRVYSRALDGYRQVVEDFPQSRYYDPARIGIANSLMALGRRSEAIADFEKLLSSLTDNSERESNRLIVLSKLAAALEEEGDAGRFKDVFEMLARDYPGSQATKDARRFADTILVTSQAAEKSAPRSGLVSIQAEPAIVGKPFKLAINIKQGAVPAGQFSIAINSAFIAQFDFVSVMPSSMGTSDYWGKRFFEFAGNGDKPFEAVFIFRARTAGRHNLDLDLGANFSLIEANQVSAIVVSEK
ncbi:hypothetical protein [Mesorhizobium argentiipisi]|uniref:Tetratricopeptide repeat protein n=1 Tax=Mesorhizobium argentiipisi TaxID=3015175 RepID=A0ABU8KCG3_9HYPH